MKRLDDYSTPRYNTMMTSVLECMSGKAIERTSCHTTDDDDKNETRIFISSVAVIDVSFLLDIENNNHGAANASPKEWL